MGKSIWFLLSLALSTSILAERLLADERSPTSLRYQVSAEMDYVTDEMAKLNKLPSAALVGRQEMFSPQPAVLSRGFGLTKARVALHWVHSQKSMLTMVLRPDALSRAPDPASGEDRVVREFDGRAGETYRLAPSLNLLDAYQLHLVAGQSMRLSFGVFESIIDERQSFRTPLEFGLKVQLPEKLSAVSLRWGEGDLSLPTAQRPRPGKWKFELWGWQAHEDRLEAFEPTVTNLDRAPSAKDPYIGVATGVFWRESPLYDISSHIAYGARRQDQQRVEELWLHFRLASELETLGHPLKVAFDLRLLKEDWAGAAADNVRALLQQSAALNAAWRFQSSSQLLAALSVGESERHGSNERMGRNTYRGWQSVLGYQYLVGEHCDFGLQYSYEDRRRRGVDGSSGSFSVAQPDLKSLHRIAISANYMLGASL